MIYLVMLNKSNVVGFQFLYSIIFLPSTIHFFSYFNAENKTKQQQQQQQKMTVKS